jgi:hypothetical protein
VPKKNERIKEAVEKVEALSCTYNIPQITLVNQMGLSYDSFMRWKRRIKTGAEAVCRPGPRKVERIDLEGLQQEVANLKHAGKRTHETGVLYRHYNLQVSRRELNTMVIEARREHRSKQAAGMQRIFWHHPDLAWAIDGSELTADPACSTLIMYNVQDLGSRYKFPPVAGPHIPCGEEVAGHLERLFTEFAAPLFLKRDNEGVLNHAAVNGVLEEHMVIPINSPTYYAQYNGAIEHTQGEFKSYLRNWAWKAGSDEGLELLAELGSHDLNHMHRRTLKGQNSCQAYFGCPRISFDRRKRREVFLWIKQATFDMLKKLGDDGLYMTAWRIAARTWLQKNRYITIVRNGKVLPCYS